MSYTPIWETLETECVSNALSYTLYLELHKRNGVAKIPISKEFYHFMVLAHQKDIENGW